jgi:hypothetical protein
MMTLSQEIAAKIERLPVKLQQEVAEYVDSLLHKEDSAAQGQLALNWRGALSHLKDDRTSVDIQHEIRDLWG